MAAFPFNFLCFVPHFGTKFLALSVYIINGFTIFAARSNNFLDYAAKNL